MQYNVNDSQALSCLVLTILSMTSLDSLFLCSVEQQAWLCSNFLPKSSLLFLYCSYKRECNAWLSMMFGHGANPIFFNKKKRLDVQNTCYPPLPTSDNISSKFVYYAIPSFPTAHDEVLVFLHSLASKTLPNFNFCRIKDIKIQGWCPKGPVLPVGEKGPL